jgi:FKBP-type peptidyl-prolyl cis-trans isomerase FklB
VLRLILDQATSLVTNESVTIGAPFNYLDQMFRDCSRTDSISMQECSLLELQIAKQEESMKKLIIAGAILGLAACQPAENKTTESPSTGVIPTAQAESATSQFATEDSKASYAIGLRYGEAIARDLPELDLENFWKGMQHGFRGEPALLKPEEAMASLQALQSRKMAEMEQAAAKKSEENKGVAAKFLAENAAREGVKTTASGLQYEVLKSGEGASPGLTDKVTVHYHGTLISGEIFDSSIQRNEPATFPVNGVIPGWTEALQMMKVGDKWKITIPSNLAYGERGAGNKIGPNETLLFEVELLKIN